MRQSARVDAIGRTIRGKSLGLIGVAVAVAGTLIGAPSSATTFVNWQGYLYSAEHSSFSPATAVTVANAGTLARQWQWRSPGPTASGQPVAGFVASPVTYDGTTYIGSNTGVFYALDAHSGRVVWSRMLGYVTRKTCAARGIAATATIAADPVSGKATVYATSGDGDLFALDAATGNIVWQSPIDHPSHAVNDYFDWSSPVVAGRRVMVGVSSQCDRPLVEASGLKAFDQVTGQLVATYLTMPPGVAGGSVWTSAAVDAGGNVFITTGNEARNTSTEGESSSMVEVSGSTLQREASWRIPANQQVADSDWSASPVLFSASLAGTPTEMVGACNKNGYFYALRAQDLGSGPVWSYDIGVGTGVGLHSCLGAAIWDGTRLYVPGNATTIDGVSYRGSLRALDPATGAPIWELGLPATVLGTPAMDSGGVIVATTYGRSTTTDGAYLVDASDGSILNFLPTGMEFAQPVFADGELILAAQSGVIRAFAPA